MRLPIEVGERRVARSLRALELVKMRFSLFLTALTAFAQNTLASKVSLTGQTVELDGSPYYLPATPVTTLDHSHFGKAFSHGSSLTPLTVVVANSSSYSNSDLGKTIACYLRDGDRVFETYWTTGRGAEVMGNSYAMLDMTVYGRQEAWEDSPEGWPQPFFNTTSAQMRTDEDGRPVSRPEGRPSPQWSRLAAGRSEGRV